MSPLALKCRWVVALIIEERSGTICVSDVTRSTGFDRRVVDDIVWDLVQQGEATISHDSMLVWGKT